MKKKYLSIAIVSVMAALGISAGNGYYESSLVKAAGETKYLAVYTTTTSYYTAEMVAAGTGNCPREAESVYLAISEDGRNYSVLNSGSGVAFASTGTTAKPLGSGRIKEPRIFRNGNGFEVVAADAQNEGKYYDFTSLDGVHYYDQVYTDKLPNAEYSSVQVIEASDVSGFPEDAGLSIGNAVEISDDEYTFLNNALGRIINTGINPVNIQIGKDNVLGLDQMPSSVNATYSDGSSQDFPVEWDEDMLKRVDISKPGTYSVTGTVKQTKYLNKLKELNSSNAAEDDPDNVNEAFPDNCDPETGTVYYDSTKYIDGLADPQIFHDEKTGYYYCTGSYFPETSLDKAGILYDRIVVRRSKTLEGLQSSSNQVTIWKAGNQNWFDGDVEKGKSYRNIWAPEIHRVGDYWVVYFTEGEEASNTFSIRCHCLVLDGDIDPFDTALPDENAVSEWKDYQMQPWSEDTVGNYTAQRSEVPFSSAFCLDMTYFEDEVNGQSYVVWAGKPSYANGGGSTDLFIAALDKEKPWELTSSSTRISWSEYGWEEISYFVNEGATVMQRNGKLYLCYSASGTGSEYAIGMLTAECGANLLDYDNWTKNPYPVLTSKDVDGEEGPGHNSFTVDEDGNIIFVYHARPTSHNYKYNGKRLCGSNNDALSDPCRHARLKRVHWQTDGTPILKMTYEDELTEENKTVVATITVMTTQAVTLPLQQLKPSTTQPIVQPGTTLSTAATTAPPVVPASSTPDSVTSSTRPSAVSKISANVTGKKIKLSWKKCSGTKKYHIYCSNKKKGKYKLVSKVNKNSYVYKKGTYGKTYYFKIRSVSGGIKSAFSAVRKVKLGKKE